MTQAPLWQDEEPAAPKQSEEKNSPSDTGTLRTVTAAQQQPQAMTGPHPAPSGLMAGAPRKKGELEPLPPGCCSGSREWVTLDFTGWADYPGTYVDLTCTACGVVMPHVPYSVGTILDALAWAGRQSYMMPIHGPQAGRTLP